jgi:hypothetical protein
LFDVRVILLEVVRQAETDNRETRHIALGIVIPLVVVVNLMNLREEFEI